MRALVADDDRGTAVIAASTLERSGLDVVVAHDGGAAWEILTSDQAPSIAILDWMMPTVDGLELCRRLRRDEGHSHTYVILLTSRDGRSDVVAGLDAGADDYLVKPFDLEELRARVQVGVRMVTLQQALSARIVELQAAMSKVKQLSGLVPICSYCKRIRSDENYWEQVESFIAEHSNAQFSHGICPACLVTVNAEFEK
jgi:phosphoserine phosphatase RsbU/P